MFTKQAKRKRKVLTRAAAARSLVDFPRFARRAATIAARSEATGLDPSSYGPLELIPNVLQPQDGETWEGVSWAFTCQPDAKNPFRQDVRYFLALANLEIGMEQRIWLIQINIDLWSDQYEEAIAMVRSLTEPRAVRAWMAVARDCVTAIETANYGLIQLYDALTLVSQAVTGTKEMYEPVYRVVRRGHPMPHNGRWFSEEPLDAPWYTRAASYERTHPNKRRRPAWL